ncbi:MAG: TIGR04282 family arsenosugar biosynthesis glycosyltransferase, partial [Flavobacteriaceae bacterium]
SKKLCVFMKSLLLVFAKTPVMGTLKTRLAKSIGDKRAFWIFQQLLIKTDSVLKKVLQDVVIFYSGSNPSLFNSIFHDFPKIPQKGASLGDRMAHAFQWGFKNGYTKIVIIGTDLWDLDSTLIKKAFESLDQTEVVIGPATDGGYYLLGKKKMIPLIFKNKEWSSKTVFNDTLKDLKKHSISFLEKKNDIDLFEDLKQQPELFKLLKKYTDEK